MGCTSDRSSNSKVFSDLRFNPILALFRILHMMRIHSVSRICPLATFLRLIYKSTWRWHTSPNQLFPKQRRCICFSARKVLLEAQKDVHSFHGTQGRPGCAPTRVNQHQCCLASKTDCYQKIYSVVIIIFSGFSSNYSATSICEDVQSSKYSDGLW